MVRALDTQRIEYTYSRTACSSRLSAKQSRVFILNSPFVSPIAHVARIHVARIARGQGEETGLFLVTYLDLSDLTSYSPRTFHTDHRFSPRVRLIFSIFIVLRENETKKA